MVGGDEREAPGDEHGDAIAEDEDGGAGGALFGREQIGAIGVGGDVCGAAQSVTPTASAAKASGAARGDVAPRATSAAPSASWNEDDPAAAAAGERRRQEIDERRPQQLERVGQGDGGEEADAGERDAGSA